MKKYIAFFIVLFVVIGIIIAIAAINTNGFTYINAPLTEQATGTLWTIAILVLFIIPIGVACKVKYG